MSAARDLACFYRTLGELLAAGVLASEALRTAAAFLPASVPAVARVAAGEPISAALARLPGCIPGEHLHFMRLGERSGSLDRVLGDLAEVAEQAESARVRIRGGLVLPGMMVHAAAVVSPLPQGLLRGDWVGYFGFALGLIGLFWAAVLGVRLLATRAAPERLDRLARASGLARAAWDEFELWRIAGALRLCVRTSLGWPEALAFAAGLCRSPARRGGLLAAAEAAERRGVAPAQAIRASGAWPAEFVAFWETGERAGSLDAAFARLAQRHADRFQHEMVLLSKRLPWFAYGLACALVVAQILTHGLAARPGF